MKKTSNLTKKKDYIRWFLRKNQLKNPDIARLLYFLLENDALLKRIRFVENIRYHSDAILISAVDTKTVPYIFRLENRYYFDTDEFISLLANNLPHRLYVCLSFDRDYICNFCQHMAEKRSAKGLSKKQLQEIEREIGEQILLKESTKKKLLELIDKALDNGNKEEFFRLTHQLDRIMNN